MLKQFILCSAAIALTAVFTALPVAAQKRMSDKKLGADSIQLMTTPLAEKAGLQNATGSAEVDAKNGIVNFVVTLPEGVSLPAGSVLEGWVVSAGTKGGPGPSSSSDADHKFGPSFGMPEFSMTVREIPYALSTGVLLRKGSTNTYVGRFRIQNSLMPYSAAVVTIETDGNTGNYDPRPGTPVLKGMIKAGMMDNDKMMDDKMMKDKMMDKKDN